MGQSTLTACTTVPYDHEQAAAEVLAFPLNTC